MTSEWILLSAGVVALSLGVLRVAFCRIAKHTRELREIGWDGPLRPPSIWRNPR